MSHWPTVVELTRARLESSILAARIATRADGALAGFAGLARERNQGRAVRYLEYEAYEPLALRQMASLADACRRRWPEVHGVGLQHRLGRVELGEASVLVAVAAEHRAPALAACAFLIDALKRGAAIWKKEFFAAGGADWLANDAAAEPPDRPSMPLPSARPPIVPL